jgi:hypothetical protein
MFLDILPIYDHCQGHVSGELRLRAHDRASWHFPSLRGRLHCEGLEFHFWDSPDSLSGASMDLLFEGDRLYLHNASGYFGGVPLTLTGDLDLNPEVRLHPAPACENIFELPCSQASVLISVIYLFN